MTGVRIVSRSAKKGRVRIIAINTVSTETGRGRLASAPETGDMIPGTGGFRKLRWADRKRGKGQRGSLRVIYYYFPGERPDLAITLYDKNEASDLSLKQKHVLKNAIEDELRV